MAEDLYRIDLQRTPAAELYAAIEEFTAIKFPIDRRPHEGFLLDFKQDLNEKTLYTVAAFANTFGGLLLLGVSDKDGRPENIVGVSSAGELKNQVVNFISSNIVPCPSFEIGECALPTDSAKKVCVVRVKESPEMCLITKKGDEPVRVRVEDNSPRADAAQLRALMLRKQSKSNFQLRFDSLRNAWASRLLVTRAHNPGPRVMSNTRSWAVLFPFEHPEIDMDVNTEKRFYSIVQKHFPCFGSADECIDPGPRSRESYQIHRLILSHDIERVWQFDSSGAFGLASQTAWGDAANGPYWSLCDLVMDLCLLLRASREFWQSFGYLGGARLAVRLGINGLQLRYDGQGFHPIFYSHSPPITRQAFAICPAPVTTTPLEEELNIGFQTGEVYVVSRIVNQLMRAQGHSADLIILEQSMKAVLGPAK